jgi:hypothetical protein
VVEQREAPPPWPNFPKGARWLGRPAPPWLAWLAGPPRPGFAVEWWAVLVVVLVGVGGGAAFPRLLHWSRWPTRLGARGLAAYVVFGTLCRFALMTLAVHVRDAAQEHERVREELREQLGREPTWPEFAERLGLRPE